MNLQFTLTIATVYTLSVMTPRIIANLPFADLIGVKDVYDKLFTPPTPPAKDSQSTIPASCF